MTKKVLILIGALITPGGLVALVIAWVATRPDVQLRVKALWSRATRWVNQHPGGPLVLQDLAVISTANAGVPVSHSRCNSTVMFPALRAA